VSTALRVALATGLLALGSQALAAQAEWHIAEPDYAWSFPRDHWAHRGYKTEWWYVTGIVADTAMPTRQFGYQFTVFRVGLVPDTLPLQSAWATDALIMGHASVSDLSNGRHVFSEVLFRPNGLLGGFGAPGDSLIAWSQGPYGTRGRWTLHWNGEAFDFAMRDDRQGVAFSFTTTPTKPLVFQGPNGFSRKGDNPTAASLYYSFTRLATEGTISIGEDTFGVSGESWMDKEFGSNQLGEDQVGWDWFSLRLDDGRDLMLYVLRSEDGTAYGRGTLVMPDGTARYLDSSTWSLDATDRWRSDGTGAEYPLRWELGVPQLGLEVTIAPLLEDQENVTALVPDLFYWEGAVEVLSGDGERIGEGYVELTGYGTRSRPAI
jgi:predicted secreted hydrolase